MEATLAIPRAPYDDLTSHLLGSTACANEEAAFVFARTKQRANQILFRYVEWMPIQPDGFLHRSVYGLELTDDVRGCVIKRAHDLHASIVEFHSHPLGPPHFSWSDKLGFAEFVPHVWWRLRGRPYAAVVVAPGGCDALAWVGDSESRVPLRRIVAGDRVIQPTCWTLKHWSEIADGDAAL